MIYLKKTTTKSPAFKKILIQLKNNADLSIYRNLFAADIMLAEFYINCKVKVGDEIYIDTKSDYDDKYDFFGGLCKITGFLTDEVGIVYVSVYENPIHSFAFGVLSGITKNNFSLSDEQEKLKSKFGNQRGYLHEYDLLKSENEQKFAIFYNSAADEFKFYVDFEKGINQNDYFKNYNKR